MKNVLGLLQRYYRQIGTFVQLQTKNACLKTYIIVNRHSREIRYLRIIKFNSTTTLKTFQNSARYVVHVNTSIQVAFSVAEVIFAVITRKKLNHIAKRR